MEQIGFFKNEDVLKSVLECLVYLGNNNIDPYNDPDKNPNRFDYDSVDSEDESNGEDNSNLQSLLLLRMTWGDERLSQQFEAERHTSTFVPKQVQVELVELLGKIVTEKVAKEVKLSGFYGIVVPDMKGISNVEDLYPICVRFVDEKNKVVEKLLTYVYYDTGCHIELALAISHAVAKAGLDLAKCRALSLDGARLSINLGAARVISQHHPLLLHFHNYSHLLDTTLASILRISGLYCAGMSRVSELFDSSDYCRDTLEAQLKEFTPELNCSELANDFKSLLASDECFKKFVDGFEALLNTLVILGDDTSYHHNYSRSSFSSPSMLLCTIDSFSTVFHSILCRNVFSHLLPLAKKLKGNLDDIMCGYGDACKVIEDLKAMQSSIDDFHHQCYEEAKNLATKLEIPEKINLIRYGKDKVAESCSSHYKTKSVIPLLDALIQALSDRFSPKCYNSVKGLALVPAVMQNMIASGNHHWQNMALDFFSQYREDMPKYECLSVELDAWGEKWSQQGSILLSMFQYNE